MQGRKLIFPHAALLVRPEEFQSTRKQPFFRHIAREALEVWDCSAGVHAYSPRVNRAQLSDE
jgi:hypothetical protein